MENTMPDYIDYALKELEKAVNRDNFNLSRDDHDAISTRIDQLRTFIKDRYGNRRPQLQQ